MKLLLNSSSNQNIRFSPSFDEKTSISLPAALSVPKLYQKESRDAVTLTKRLEVLQNSFPNKEWTLNTEFRFYDPGSPKLDIALEGELLKTLHDILYYGSNNESLQVSIQATAQYADESEDRSGRTSHKQSVITAKNMELATDDKTATHFRYIQKEIVLPDVQNRGQLVWTSLQFSWKILVEVEVNGLVDLTGLLPQVSDQYAKMLEEKLFCDFEFISSDGISQPCHKAIISASSDPFRAKCLGKLDEPSKNQMIMKMTAESVNALLEFIYCGKVRKPMTSSLIAAELFQEGHGFQIVGLEEAMVAIFLQKPNEWYDVEVAFNLLRFVVDYEVEFSSELTTKFIEALAVKSDELNFDSVKEVYAEFPQLAVQMFATVIQEVKNRLD